MSTGRCPRQPRLQNPLKSNISPSARAIANEIIDALKSEPLDVDYATIEKRVAKALGIQADCGKRR